MKKPFENKNTGAFFEEAFHVPSIVQITKQANGTFITNIHYHVYVNEDMWKTGKSPVGTYMETVESKQAEKAFNLIVK